MAIERICEITLLIPSFGRFFGGGFDVDVVCVHPAFTLIWWLIHLSMSYLAAKGKGATTYGGRKGVLAKVFAALRKKF